MELPQTHLDVHAAFVEHAETQRARALADLQKAVDWRQQALDALNAVTTEFLLTGIVELPVHLYQAPHVFHQRGSFSWMTYVEHLAHDQRRPLVVVHPGDSWTMVTIERHAYTLPLAARFLLLEARNICEQTHRWRFSVPPGQAEMVALWRADCGDVPELRKALRLVPEYRPAPYRPAPYRPAPYRPAPRE